MTTPFASSALNHGDAWPALSSRGSATRVRASGGSFAQNASIASAPSLPGLPETRRSSISFLSPKSERLAPLAPSSFQFKPRSAVSTRRSDNPRARGALAAVRASDWPCVRRLLGLGRHRLRRDQAAQDLLHHVALHVAVEERLFGLLGEHLRVAIGHVAREEDLARRQIYLGALGIGDPDSDAIAQLIFAHAARGVEREDDLVAQLRGEAEDGLRVADAVDKARLARDGDVALELDRERRASRNVERLERQLSLAAQLEAAAGEERGREGDDRETVRRPH